MVGYVMVEEVAVPSNDVENLGEAAWPSRRYGKIYILHSPGDGPLFIALALTLSSLETVAYHANQARLQPS